MRILNIVGTLRSVRDRITGLNATAARFDILQRKLDALLVATESLCLPGDIVHRDVRSDQLGTKMVEKSSNAGPTSVDEQVHGDESRICREEENISSAVSFLQPHEAIRIVFIAQHPAVWPTWHSVWSAVNADSRFVAKVVLTQFRHPFSSGATTYDDMRRCLIDADVPFCSDEFFDVKAFKPHVAFVQNPYEDTRSDHLKIDSLRKAGARVAYVPYGLELGGGAWNIAAQFDSPLHRGAWRIFARSERHKKMFGKYCRAGNHHVIVTGHPKFDLRKQDVSSGLFAEIKRKASGRKVILWTPHFSVAEPAAWSTYRLYGEFIVNMMRGRRDMFLLIRPHPLFFQAMRQHKVWDEEGENEFRKAVRESENLALDESVDYQGAFEISDALMTDVGSFMLEYLPTGKPLLYLEHPNGLGMNDDGDLVRYLYKACSSQDVANFVDQLASGHDPLKAQRMAVISEFLFGLDSSAGERIVEHIYSSLKVGDTWSSGSCERVSSDQSTSECYWQCASDTYLAPSDYYDRKEAILKEVLAGLARFGSVIDIGCGDGRFTLMMADRAVDVMGYDISQSLVEKAREAATRQNIRNVRFLTEELESIKPLQKYDLVACMGVTSCIIDDAKFLRVLDNLRLLARQAGYLFLVDTLSSSGEQMASDENGYVAKYRTLDDYLTLVERRGFQLQQEILIKEIGDRDLVNKMFVFEFRDSPLAEDARNTRQNAVDVKGTGETQT